MAIVQHAANQAVFSSGTTGSVTVTISAAGAGNALVACIAVISASAAPTVAGVKTGTNTENWVKGVGVSDVNNGVDSEIWVDLNTAGGGTSVVVTANFGQTATSTKQTAVQVDVFEVSGVLTSAAIDKTSAAPAGNDTASWSSGATATTSQASEIAFGHATITPDTGGTGTQTPPGSPWTNETIQHTSASVGGFGTFNFYSICGFNTLSSTGTVTYSGTASATAFWEATVLTLKMASGSTPVAQSDTAAAADAVAVAAAVPEGDTAAAKDALAVTAVGLPLADTAAASDAMSVLIVQPVALSDTAAASDALAVTVSAPLSDTAAAADLAANVTPQPVDHAAAADKLAAAVAAPQADTAAASDSMVIGLHPADTAAASESMSIVVGISMLDTAAAKDNIGVVGPGSGPAGFGSTLPASIINAFTPPGYPGGPSGAGSIAPDALGNGWEIEVRAGSDYNTLLAVIPGSMLLNFQFVRQLNDIGSGTVQLNQDDPWWSEVTLPGGLPTETLLDDECLWQVWKDGVCRFEFLGETVTEQLADPSEQRQATITGPGTLTTLKWAMVAPQGFPNIVLKLDGLLDAFDEVDNNGNPVLDTNIWTTATPAADVYITPISVIYNYPTGAGYALSTLYPSGSLTLSATPGTTFLGASPYDATDTLISAQVTPIGAASTSTDSTTPAPYGTGLNGSELTQFYIQSNLNSGDYALIGLSGTAFYAQMGTSGSAQTKVLPAYDSQNHAYWMITEQAGSGGGQGTFYFWTSPDGQQWTLQWQCVHSWDATNTTFFVTAAYSVAGTETAQLANLNSNVTTPSYQGSIYLGLPMMGIWFDQFTRAQARGTIPFVTTVATPAADSYGRAWTDVENVQAVNGTDLYSFLQGATSVVDADYVMDPGFQLRIGIPAAGQVALGVDRSNYLIFRDGYDVMARQRVRARDSIATLIGGENSDGHEISASAPAFVAEWGQREAWFQTAAQVDPVSMAYATASSLAENETEIVSWSFNLLPNVPGKTVFDNFDVGDWVGLERPDFSAVDKVRVVGIAVQVDSSGAETHELTFQSYIQWLAEQLTYLANKLGGSFVNTLGTTPVAPSRYGTGQVPTYFTPAATLSGLADVSSTAGSAQSTSPLVYNPATGQYQHAGTTDPVTGQMVPVTVSTPNGSVTVGDTTVVVETGNGSTVSGLQGDGTVTTVDTGGSAPSVPDAPLVAGIAQGLSVSWDGLLAGTLPLSNFRQVQVYVGTSSGFTPSASTLVGTMTVGGALTVSGLTAGTTYYAKLVAVTTSGATSAPTAGISAIAQALPTTALTGQLPASLLGASAGSWALNPNPFFNGGDLTGWFVTNGTVAPVVPPAGAPGNPQFAAQVTSTAANCLLTGSPAPFQVTPGQPYAMTAWVYNPSGSAVTVAAGFNWSGGTGTVSCAPNAWTPVTSVQQCPVGVTSAYQVIGPTASGKTVYITGAVAAGQVSGQLLAANSVTANQIAANTITAAQIAAATITASQIAANTITASQIAASTITATQIAANTITAAQIAANTITASQIAAGTITASQIAAGIILAGVVNGTTIMGASIVADGSNGEILVYAGTPTSGNLIMSVSAVAGSDSFGNGYLAGVFVYNSSGGSIGFSPAANTALVMTPGVTPAPVSGSPQMFANAVGHALVQDGADGQTYQTQRRTLFNTVASGTLTTLAPVFTTQCGNATYRVHGQLYINATVAGWQFTCKIAGSGALTGHFAYTILHGSGSNAVTQDGGPNTSVPTGVTMGTGEWVVMIDGLFTQTVINALQLQVGSTTATGFSVDPFSFFEVMPV